MSTVQEQQAFLEALFRMGRPGFPKFQHCSEKITKGEFFVLHVVHTHAQQCPQAKGMYVSELAELMRVSPPAISRMLRGMELRSYLQRVVDLRDRRTTYVVLTPQGEALWSSLQARALAFAGQIIDQLGCEDTATLVRLLGRLHEIVQEEPAKEF